MDLRLLRYFTAVADEGSLTKGAAKLNMSQPPLSTQLKHFEDELGVKLFERTPHGIKLTQAGHYLRSRAYEIFSLVEQTEIILQKMGDTDSNRLSIGCVPTISEMYLSEWLSNFKERYPDVDFHIYEGDTNAILHLIDSGNVDIGVVRMPIDEDKYNYGVLSREETYAAINEKNPLCELARDDSIDFSQILKAKLILPTRQQAILPLPDSAQSKLNVICTCHSISQGLLMVRKDIGVSIVPMSAKRLYTDKSIRFFRIENPTFTSTVVLAWRKDIPLSHTAERFMKMCR